MLKGVTEGRIVKYCLAPTDLPEHRQNQVGQYRAAMIVNAWSHLDRDDGYSNLLVFMDGTNDMDAQHLRADELRMGRPIALVQFIYWATSKIYSEEKIPGTWRWPERV